MTASAAREAKNNHEPWASVTTLHRLQTIQRSQLFKHHKNYRISSATSMTTCSPADRRWEGEGRERRALYLHGSLPLWLCWWISGMACCWIEHKLLFSREYSPALKAPLLSLALHSFSSQPEECHPVQHPHQLRGKETGRPEEVVLLREGERRLLEMTSARGTSTAAVPAS